MSYRAQFVTFLTAAALATFAAFSSGRAADQTPKLLTEHFMIDAVDPGRSCTLATSARRT
jgi:hypothetical protein